MSPATEAGRPAAFHASFPSPVGELFCAVDEAGAVLRIDFPAENRAGRRRPAGVGALEGEGLRPLPGGGRLEPLRCQLEEYFRGERRSFELAVAPSGTEFQRRVWDALAGIPFGETRSYADIARVIDRPTAFRAVGAANGANPIPIVVPCHRVVGKSGDLTGFGGGLAAKRWLLAHEGIGEDPQRRLF